MDAAFEKGKLIRLERRRGPRDGAKAHKSVQMTSYRRVMQLSLQLRRATWVTGQLAWRRVGCIGGVGVCGWRSVQTRGERDSLGSVDSRRGLERAG